MKIAIVQLGRIGDLILVSSAINIIKSKYPEAEIDFIVGPSNEIIIRDNPNVSKVLIFDKNPIKLIPFIIKLRSKLYDFYVDPKDHISTESNILANIANAVIKVGFNDATKSKKTFDISIPSDKENINLHFIERIENIFKLIDINTHSKSLLPNIYITNEAKIYAESYLKQNKIEKYILINISASNNDRMWMENKWIEFINTIKNRTKYQIVLTQDIKDLKQAQNISQKTNVNYIKPTNLLNIAAIINNSALLISTDTSLIHIATTFDIPVITLMNDIPHNTTKFAPLSSKKIIVLPEKSHLLVEDITTNQLLVAFDYMISSIST